VLWVVLPLVALASLATVHILVVVPIEIIVVVDVDVAVVPIAIAPIAASPSAQSKSPCTPRQSHPGIVSRIGVRIVGIGRRGSPVNNFWIVRRNVNYVGLGWLDYYHLLAALDRFGLHVLLRAGF